MAEVAKGGPTVLESILKKQKRNEEWVLAKKQKIEALKKKNATNMKLIFKRAKQYSEKYEAQELIRLKREARLKGGFYVNPEAKMAFIIRICGINPMDPKSKKILQLLRLRQMIFSIAYSRYPNLKSVKELNEYII